MNQTVSLATDLIDVGGGEAVKVDRLLTPRDYAPIDAAFSKEAYFKWVQSQQLTDEQLRSLVSNCCHFGPEGRRHLRQILSHAVDATQRAMALWDSIQDGEKRGMKPVSYAVLQHQGFPLTTEDPNSSPTARVLKLRRDIDFGNRGLTLDEKGRLRFNANRFVEYFLKRVTLVLCGNFYIYDSVGFYRKITESNLKKLARIVLHEAMGNIWCKEWCDDILEVLSLHTPQFPEMDAQRDVVNLTNGMLNPLTGDTLKHGPQHLSTVQLEFAYNPDATCPTFDRFLREVMMEDPELINLVQEIIGYLLVCDARCQKAFFFHGQGANGKSLLAEIIRHVCGKRNVSNTSLRRLEGRFGFQELPGKTVNISTENEFTGREISTETFKAIVGGDAVSIERKFKDAYSAKLFVRLVVLTNSLPRTRDFSHGYFRRIQFVPFTRTFRDAEADKSLLEKILPELPGILNFAIEGLRRLDSQGYQFSEAKAATDLHESYMEQQNPFIDFCKDAIKADQDSVMSRADMQKVFAEWCQSNGLNDWASVPSQRFWGLFRESAARAGLSYREKKVRGVRQLVGLRVAFQDLTPEAGTIVHL